MHLAAAARRVWHSYGTATNGIGTAVTRATPKVSTVLIVYTKNIQTRHTIDIYTDIHLNPFSDCSLYSQRDHLTLTLD